MMQVDVGSVSQPRTLFKPGSWLTKIDFINHLILFNNVLITVLSENEGGKSSFSALLHSNLDSQIKPVFIHANPPCDSRALIDTIASQLHLNHDAYTDMTSIVAQINERKAHVLLIIDDAHHLPEAWVKEALFTIKNQDNFGFFHLCLVSDYSIVATLNHLALDQFNNLIHSIELGPLNESETRTYVLQRAMTARLINKPLTDAQYKQFYQMTKGNLAKINNSLESFIQKCATQTKTNKMRLVKQGSVAVSAAMIAGLSYLYYGHVYKTTSPTDLVKVIEQSQVKQYAMDKPAQLISQIPSWQDSATRQLVHFELPKKQNLDETADDTITNTVAIVDKVVVIPKVKPSDVKVTAQRVEHQAQARDHVIATTEAVTVSNSTTESKLVALNPAQHDVAVTPITKTIKSSSGHYTIQLVASHNKTDVERFNQTHQLIGKTQMRQFTNKKGNWYILTIGEFESLNQAQLSTKQLPPELAKLKPWVRPVNGLNNVG